MIDKQPTKRFQISSFKIIIMGFVLVILAGTFLLMLPFASVEHGCASFKDALFTATSAACVTGLVVQDTATYWTFFGQAVILVLIQIGGMGVITVAIAIAIFSGRKIGLKQRSTMKEAISAQHVGGIVKMTGFIFKFTILMEVSGALLFSTVFIKEFGFSKGIWYSIFHSISAYCNAGFDLMGVRGQYSSLTTFANSPLINIVAMILIVFGGLGFATWIDIKNNRQKFKKYKMQSKVVIVTSAILILVPAIYFYFFEFSSLNANDRFFQSAFQSVTTRTAGFNTADLTLLSQTGRMLMILLMIVGGSPGSTAGGMKTTTLAVMAATSFSVFSKKDHANYFKRRIPESAQKNAFTICFMYIFLFVSAAMMISRIDNVDMLTAMFETASAVGTVGLTLGITPTLSTLSQLILIPLMFFGRVGGLTLIFAAYSKVNASKKYPEDKITVG